MDKAPAPEPNGEPPMAAMEPAPVSMEKTATVPSANSVT